MALSAFVAFSALVGVSVALSNGTAPAPWESAAARETPDLASREQTSERVAAGQAAEHGARDQAEDREDVRHKASLFAVAPDPARVPELRPGVFAEGGAGAWDGAGPQLVNATGPAGGQGASSLSPATRAPARFEGELPVNTIIAPAQPVTVLDGGQFGWRIAPDTGQRDFHNGTDISVPQGTPVVAALDGTVTAVFWDVWGGNRVEVTHADGLKTTYNHMEHVMVRQGDVLRASEQLGTAGQTGLRVTGPHLHFETYVNDRVVDAQSFDWKIGEEIIAASRPQQSLADQAPVPQAPVDAGARPGTDNGSVADVPPSVHDHVVALSESVAPTHGPDGKPGAGSAGGKATPNGSGGPANHGADTQKDKMLEAAGKQAAGSTVPGKTPPGQKGPAAQPAAGGGKPVAGNPGKDGRDHKPGTAEPSAAPVQKPAKPAAPAPEKPGKGTPANGAGTTGAGSPDKGGRDQDPGAAKLPTGPAQSRPQPAAPTPEKTAVPANPGANPTPDESSPSTDKELPDDPGAGDDKSPVTEPEGGGKNPEAGTKDPAADNEQIGAEEQNPPQQPQLNPYTAPIAQLTTLEQIQQRTQYLLNPQGQETELNQQLREDLAALSEQLAVTGLGKQDATGFAQQLTATQQAVTQAAAAPADGKLADQAAKELKTLRDLVAHVPAFAKTAAAPGTR